MRSMLKCIAPRGNWTRIERRDYSGRLLDFVEVGQCAACGCGVDRDFPIEYREHAGRLVWASCAAPRQLRLVVDAPVRI